MKILLTGATGYIGKRLLPVLIGAGHEVVCCVRDKKRFNPPESLLNKISVIEIDFLKTETLDNIPNDIDAGFYLVHSMSASKNYKDLERTSAINFRNALNKTKLTHLVYLSGIVNELQLSEHLSSRKEVEVQLNKGNYNLTVFRAGIIIGSGSASFEIIRDLVEKLPVMITPKWLKTKCQPIAISDVIQILNKSILNDQTHNQNYDIGGPDILTYKEMLLTFANVRKLKRFIFIIPIMTPRLSSYWLYFVTSTSYKLAVSLVNSMKIEVVCRDTRINDVLIISPISYVKALENALERIDTNTILSSWKDSYSSSGISFNISDFINVPTHGCYFDIRRIPIKDFNKTVENVWKIGGNNGWYYANWLWKLRGFIDKLIGGVGLRRGRTNNNLINVGDTVDFWRVLYVNKVEGRLLLFAEMKLPGEAWLEFKVSKGDLIQRATFRPLGIKGRLYWYMVLPLHGPIFKGMLKKLAS